MPKDLILYALFGGHFYWDNDIRRGIIVVAWQYSGQKLFFSGRKKISSGRNFCFSGRNKSRVLKNKGALLYDKGTLFENKRSLIWNNLGLFLNKVPLMVVRAINWKIFFFAILLPCCHGSFERHLYKGVSERGSNVAEWQQKNAKGRKGERPRSYRD